MTNKTDAMADIMTDAMTGTEKTLSQYYGHETQFILISAPDLHPIPYFVPTSAVQSYSEFCRVVRTLFRCECDPYLVRIDTAGDPIIHPILWKSLLPVLGNSRLVITFAPPENNFPVDQPSVITITTTSRFFNRCNFFNPPTVSKTVTLRSELTLGAPAEGHFRGTGGGNL